MTPEQEIARLTAERDNLDEALTTLNGQYDGLMVQVARLEAELAAANQRLSEWETAVDSWMVTNWIGVYERERGVSETLSMCLERALDQERDTLRAELESEKALLKNAAKRSEFHHQEHLAANREVDALKAELAASRERARVLRDVPTDKQLREKALDELAELSQKLDMGY